MLFQFRALRVARTQVRAASTRTEQLVVDLVRELEETNAKRSTTSPGDTVHMNDSKLARPDLERTRIMPRDASFYMDNPPYEEVMRTLNGLLLKHINLPTVDQNEYLSQKWKNVWENAGKSRKRDFRAYSALATRLDMIDPQLMPREVEQVLDHLRQQGGVNAKRTAVGSGASNPRIDPLDEQGRATVVARRKTSSARVTVVEANGTGSILVNGVPLAEYFGSFSHRQKVAYPLSVVDQPCGFNVFATVSGGGLSGQAGAIANGVGLALRMHNPLLAPRLKKAGCIKPDTRQKERKKPGLAKARKAYTWVKR